MIHLKNKFIVHGIALIAMMLLSLMILHCSAYSYIIPQDELSKDFAKAGLNRGDYIIPFTANDEMKAFARRVTQGVQGVKAKCRKLVRAMLNKSLLNVRYEKTYTLTARELFYQGKGNCLAYTNLFISLARSIGIPAIFVDASLLVHGLDEREGVIVNNGHIVAGVFVDNELLFIDFSDRVQDRIIGYRFIDDVEAIANYYNNIGFEKHSKAIAEGMNAMENIAGMEEFKIALRIKPNFYRAQNNLGVVYQHLGNTAKAEEAYLKAIKMNKKFTSPYTNLGMLYFKRGDFARSKRMLKKALKLNKSNYFIQYYLALISYKQKDVTAAKKNLERCLKIKPDFKPAQMLLQHLSYDNELFTLSK